MDDPHNCPARASGGSVTAVVVGLGRAAFVSEQNPLFVEELRHRLNLHDFPSALTT